MNVTKTSMPVVWVISMNQLGKRIIVGVLSMFSPSCIVHILWHINRYDYMLGACLCGKIFRVRTFKLSSIYSMKLIPLVCQACAKMAIESMAITRSVQFIRCSFSVILCDPSQNCNSLLIQERNSFQPNKF